jgi:hypothetical protein
MVPAGEAGAGFLRARLGGWWRPAEEVEMSSAALMEREDAVAQSRGLFDGRARWIAALLLLIGPLLQVVEFVLEEPANDNAARVAYWIANTGRVQVAMASGLLAVPFLIGAITVIVLLTRGRSPRLALVAAAFMACGMAGLAAIHGVELGAYSLAVSGNRQAAVSVLNGNNLGLEGGVLLALFLGGAVLGTLTLAIAVWRSPLVPRVVTVFIVAFAVLDFAVGQGVISHIANLIGFSIAAVAVLTAYSRAPESTSWRARLAW